MLSQVDGDLVSSITACALVSIALYPCAVFSLLCQETVKVGLFSPMLIQVKAEADGASLNSPKKRTYRFM